MTLGMMARGPGLEQDHTGLSSKSRAAGSTPRGGGGGGCEGLFEKRKATIKQHFMLAWNQTSTHQIHATH